jgi:transcription initiation factor IIE alpha subunit
MEVITIETQVFKELMAKINTIAKFVASIQAKADETPEDGWVDSYEVCTFLKISAKTLQRLRKTNSVTFSRIRGKNFYKISEIWRLMDENIIRRTDEHLQDLIKNHKWHVEQRRNTKTDR